MNLRACCFAVMLPVVASAQTSQVLPGPSGKARLRFEISVPAAGRGEPTTGRVYVMFSKTNEREPRLQVGRVGAPLFGRDVDGLRAGQAAVIDGTALGTPVTDLADIPAGE